MPSCGCEPELVIFMTRNENICREQFEFAPQISIAKFPTTAIASPKKAATRKKINLRRKRHEDS